MDSALVRGYYLDGDFDPAIDVLETYLTLHRVHTHEDSVFTFKHLGVMHAAKYETREKGKHYMLKLLETEPTARILDMYASDMIYMIFKNIQDEYMASRRKFEHADATLAQRPREDKPAEEKEEKPVARKKGGGSVLYWLGAGVVVAAGVATYVALSDEPKTTDVEYPVQ
ncbi:MAG TPA: hypothetical protein VK465_05035 [Fibrobacteria bacterium]|nr:hypothetical protein [Fibrobacteria bacterium]